MARSRRGSHVTAKKKNKKKTAQGVKCKGRHGVDHSYDSDKGEKERGGRAEGRRP
jgi:hypothetical protein